jgi:hypothetical protein
MTEPQLIADKNIATRNANPKPEAGRNVFVVENWEGKAPRVDVVLTPDGSTVQVTRVILSGEGSFKLKFKKTEDQSQWDNYTEEGDDKPTVS